mgnify:CR=1 FL=1
MRTLWLVCVVAVVASLGAAALAAAAEAGGPPDVEVHGWMETRFYSGVAVDVTQDESGAIVDEEEDSAVKTERISLSGLVRLADGKSGYAEIYIHPWLPNDNPSFLYLESLYLDVPAGAGARYRIGKGRSLAFGIVPSYGARKTSNYSPLAEAFTMDRAVGIQYARKVGDDELAFGLFNSQRVGSRLIGQAADLQMDRGSTKTTTVAHLCSRDVTDNRSGQLETSLRVGRQLGYLNLGLSGRLGALDETDSATLAKSFATYNGTNRTRLNYGVDATYKRMPLYGTFEYYRGSLGGIRQTGYGVLLGVEPTPQCTGMWRELSSVCKGLYLRYVNLDIDVPAVPTVSTTWDTQQYAISYVLPIRCKQTSLPKWIQIEYERNTEDAPAPLDSVPNNVFFIELFTAF